MIGVMSSRALVASLLVVAGCASDVTDAEGGGGNGAGGAPRGGGGAGEGGSGFGGTNEGGAACACAPGIHQTQILVLSDDGEIWSFDTTSKAFALVRPIPCPIANPY